MCYLLINPNNEIIVYIDETHYLCLLLAYTKNAYKLSDIVLYLCSC